MSRYKQPSLTGKIVFFVILPLIIAALFLIQSLQGDRADYTPQELLDSLFQQALFATLFYLALSALAFWIALTAIKERQWPLKKIPVPVRTKVREVQRPWKVWIAFGFVLVYSCFLVATAWYPYILLLSVV